MKRASVCLMLRGAYSVDVDVPDEFNEAAIVEAAKKAAWVKLGSEVNAATLEYDDKAGHDVYVDDEKISADVMTDEQRNAATLATVIGCIGGTCDEGTPTSPINYLQRLRALMREEAALIRLADDYGDLTVKLKSESAWGATRVLEVRLGALVVACVRDCPAHDAEALYAARKRGAPLWPRGT